MFICNENSSFCLKLELRDKEGNELYPIDSISWWVGNPRNELIIVPQTEITIPEWNSEIKVPVEANTCSGRRDEERIVSVKVVSGVNVKHENFRYIVKNLGLVPYSGEE